MLRTTWEKTNNPYVSRFLATSDEQLRFLGRHFRVKLPVVRYVYIPRPKTSSRAKLPPVKAMLFFDGSEEELTKATELVLDFPGGGFTSMGPECHEERLRVWAKRTHKPILSIDYGKAPECEPAVRPNADIRSVPMGYRRRHRCLQDCDRF